MAWDGIKHEEIKARNRKCENPKSRGNYSVGFCGKNCLNRDKKCDDCIRFSEFIEMESK